MPRWHRGKPKKKGAPAGGEGDCDEGNRRRGSPSKVEKRNPGKAAMLREVVAQQLRRRDDGGGDIGSGVLHWCGGLGEGGAPEGIGGEHHDGERARVTESTSRRPEKDRGGCATVVTGVEGEARRRGTPVTKEPRGAEDWMRVTRHTF